MMKFIWFLFLTHRSVYGICQIQLHDFNDQSNGPLLLERVEDKLQLLVPKDSTPTYEAGETIILGCPNDNQTIHTIKCFSIDDLHLSHKLVSIIHELKCQENITGNVQMTSTPCGGAGIIYNVGFDFKDKGFIPAFQSCFNLQTLSVIYTKHHLYNNGVPFSFTIDNPIKIENIHEGINIEKYYQNQNKMHGEELTQLLLVPIEDSFLKSWKIAASVYINSAPQWESINSGNWHKIEAAIRNFVKYERESVTVYTGVHGILKLSNKPVYLTNYDLVEVPKWFWKIIKSNDSSIAFVTLNSVSNAMGSEEMLCPNICAQNGWQNDDFNKPQLGTTYCCEVHTLRENVPTIPEDAVSSKILTKSNDMLNDLNTFLDGVFKN